MSEDRKDKDLQRELERLGEPAADAEEIAAAERLAARLEDALHVASAAEDGELGALATTLRSSAKDTGAAGAAGAAAADRALASIFGDTAEGQSPDQAPGDEPGDEPTNELEQRRAETLATGVDRMIAGLPASDAPADVHDLLLLAGLIRAAVHATALSPGRLETLVDQAYGKQAPAAATPRDAAKGRTSTVLRLALVAVLSVVVLGAALIMGDSLRRGPAPSPSPSQTLPTHLTSRSTRDILPGAFERGQTSTERINLIYQDRLRSFRELHLGGQQTGRRP